MKASKWGNLMKHSEVAQKSDKTKKKTRKSCTIQMETAMTYD